MIGLRTRARRRRFAWALLAAFGCGDDAPPPSVTVPAPAPQPEPEPAGPDWLPPEAQLVRASIAIRGVRPDPDDVAAVIADPTAYAGLVDAYLLSDAFGTTIEDMHGEFYRVRTDIEPQYPAKGALVGVDLSVIHEAAADEPLRLVKDIVTRGLPYTEVVTADWILSDATLATMFGLPFDPYGPELQPSWWSDGRPPSGVLSSTAYYDRYPSNGNNFHRQRAAVAAEIFLCDEIGLRDTTLSVESAPPSTSVDQVIDTLSEPGCAGCHATLEPLASFFWGYAPVIPHGPLSKYMDVDCDVPDHDETSNHPPGTGYAEDLCYPLRVYTPAYEDLWVDFGLPAPALYGRPGDGVGELGQLIATDPRFPRCAARRFAAWFTQTPLDQVDDALVGELSARFVGSGYDARDLVRAIVSAEAFRTRASPDPTDPGVGLLVVRPEQYASQIEAFTGFVWRGEDRGACGEAGCWGTVDLMRSDLFGYRALAGGIDGAQQIAPVHTPTPTRALTLDRFAAEAAGHVVDADLALPSESRRLLVGVDPADISEHAVRPHLAALYNRILSRPVSPTSEAIDALYALFAASLSKTGDPARAWKLVLIALFTDPQMVLY